MKTKKFPQQMETETSLRKKGMKPDEITEYLKKQFEEMWNRLEEDKTKHDKCPECGAKIKKAGAK